MINNNLKEVILLEKKKYDIHEELVRIIREGDFFPMC
jgi:hypothetical protein